MLAKLAPHHRAKLASLLADIPQFSADERAVALELVDEALARPEAGDYRFVVVEEEEGERLLGYACFGPTPMTQGCFDLYWLAVHPAAQRRGLGRRLVEEVERELTEEGARLLRVETAGLDAYTGTRRFYESAGYGIAGRIQDFYWRGNDLYVFTKYLDPNPPR